MPDALLTFNAGSSSIKFALFTFQSEPRRLAHGQIEGIGERPRLRAFDPSSVTLEDRLLAGSSHEDFLGPLLAWVADHLGGDRLVGVGHRIVHGGEAFTQPVTLNEGTMTALEALSPLAPLHQPHNLAAVRAIKSLRPDLRQIGCFDTAFHCTIDPGTRRYGLPRDLERQGIRKYGFHGLSYEFVSGRLRELAPTKADGRVIIAHLGNGASLCALHQGRSMDTSMGFSPLDGLVMATRCGSLDPGILLHLMRQGMDANALEDLLYHRAGLLGVSGMTGDMRSLLGSRDCLARDAVELFVSRAVREIGALAAGLKGLDVLVFTAGIGENAAEIRRLVCGRLAWMGLALDEAANDRGSARISLPASGIDTWVIPTDEEQVIARHTSAQLYALEPYTQCRANMVRT